MSKAVTGRHVKHLYEFGPFTLDALERVLMREGQVVPLTPKAIDTLFVLVQGGGHIIEKEELLRQVWPDTFVEESTLAQNVFTLRKVLGNGKNNGTQFIETIPKRGYRFIAEIREILEPSNQASPEVDMAEQNFAASTTTGISIHKSGEGISVSSPPATSRLPEERKKKSNAILITIIALLTVASIGSLYIYSKPTSDLSEPAAKMSVARFTSTGNSFDAAISPDGRYVVYAVNDAGRQSLWVRQVATGSRMQVVPPAEVSYQGLSFSQDGDYIFYNVWDRSSVGAIYKVPALGGPATKVIYDVMPSLAISPDGNQIAFIRCQATTESQMLMVARTDGSDERVIALHDRSKPGWFCQPAWSPDGRRVACGMGVIADRGLGYMQLIELSAEGGQERVITPERWLSIGGLAWLKDGNTLVMTAIDQEKSPLQIWAVSYKDGKARKITNDLNGFCSLSLTADSASLVSVQGEQMSNVWVAPQGDTTRAIKITSGRYEGGSLAWTPEGRIVYVSCESGNADIWIMDADGQNKKQLTFDENADFDAKIAAGGRYIVFVSNRTGSFHLWRMNLDGSDQRQLTHGGGEGSPTCSASGDSVVYISVDSGKKALWKTSVEGGEPVALTTKYSFNPSLSPDGKMVAYSFWDSDAKPERWAREVISTETGRKINDLDIPSSAIWGDGATSFQWTSDGRSLTYVNNRNGVDNVWSIPLDRSQSKQLSNFKSDYIFAFAWSPDGKWLTCSRGTAASDVVLITDFY